jgi:trehalose 6-phosphate phosphatase
MKMRNMLAQGNREVLEQFAWSNALIAFDYDGTLAPIVVDPELAFMRPTTSKLLEKVAALYPTIVISGRAQEDALSRLAGIGLREVVGNHGLEPWCGADHLVEMVRTWRAKLEVELAALKGIQIEDKGLSLAIHYRQSREKKAARTAILRAISPLPRVRVIGGKQVVNVVPVGGPHKGIALERERDRLRCDTAIYVGDDETDEDVFALDQPGRLLSIRVGAKKASSAGYYIARQASIDGFLRSLVDLRRSSEQRKRAAR